MRLMFINAGRTLNARGISLKLGVSQPAVSKALPFLAKEGLVRVEKDWASKRRAIGLNIGNDEVVWLKRVDNLKQVYESGLVRFLYDTFPGATIILFGSYSFGDDTAESDIDLAVIGAREKSLDLAKYEKLLGRPIVLNYYEHLSKVERHLRNNLLDGIIIKGGVEL